MTRSVRRQEAALLGFLSQGCYAEPPNARALVGNDYFDDEMTLEKCAASCGGYFYFGAEFGRECWVSSSPSLSNSRLNILLYQQFF